MTFTLHHGGIVMSSQITITQSSNTHPLAHIQGTCALISSSCAIFTVYQKPHQVTASHPSLGDNPPERGRAVRKNAGKPCENGLATLNSITSAIEIIIIIIIYHDVLAPPRRGSHVKSDNTHNQLTHTP